nr:putative reverse transcriptase domain-containing protein [Tanacetum cinerariifolium]
FDVIIRDIKVTENLATSHLSRLENPHQDELEKKEITETFPLENLDREIGYGIIDVWEDPDEIVEEIPATDVADQLNSLRRDRRSHARTARLMESEARASREAWVQSMDASNMECSDVRALQTIVLAQHIEIGELRKMAPKRTTSSSPSTKTTTTTPVTDAQLKALIDQGVDDALAARDADRSRNGKDSHDSGTGVRRKAPIARECTYPDFMKCKPLYFKATEGVVELTQWECPKLKNNNHGNQGGNDNAPAKVYVMGNAGTNHTPTSLRKYMLKGCHVFLAHVTTKEAEDKSEGKRLEDVPIVRDFPEVFPEDFSGLPLTQQVEF